MKVLFWSERFPPLVGGVSTAAAELLPALRERGVELAVVTASEVDEAAAPASFAGARVYRLPFWSTLAAGRAPDILALGRQVADLVRGLAPEVVHLAFLGPSAFFLLHVLAQHPAPYLVVLDAALPESGLQGQTIVARALTGAARIVAPSRAALARLRALAPQHAARLTLIYHGRSRPSLPPSALPFDPPRLLCVGRLECVKGFDLAVEALALVRRSIPDATLTIAGDGPERPALEELASKLGVREAVELVGQVEPARIPAVINTATLVLQPSRSEAFGLAAVEAGLMARPVIAARVGGLPEAVVDGRTGLLVDPEDPAALAHAILRVLGDRDLATRLGRTARRSVAARFGVARAADRYLSLYRELAPR